MSTLRRLVILVLPAWREVLAAVGLGALTIASSVGLLGTSAYLIAAAALHPSIAELQVAIVGVRFFGISRGVLRYLERLVSHGLTFRLLARLRVWFYRAVEPLAPARLVSARSGDLLNRAIADIETLENLYVRVLAPPLVALVLTIGMAVFMATFDESLAAALLVFLLAVGGGLTALSLGLGRDPGRRLVDARARLRAELVDSLQGLPELVAYGQVEAQLARVKSVEHEVRRAQWGLARINALQAGLTSLLSNLGVWVVLFLGIPLVGAGRIEGVHLAVVVLAAMASFEAVTGLPQAAQLFEGNLQAARRLFEIADLTPVVSDPSIPQPVPDEAGLTIRGLRFRYAPGEAPVLNGLDLDLPAGARIAIVGPSGAGKTSLVRILLRLWEYDDGDVRLGGQELRQLAQVEARRQFSVVAQDTYLFHASLRENLRLADPQAGEDELLQAVEQAGLGDFVRALPEGLDTYVGERGLQLSGGERQRVAIARALLKPSRVLIFDEPTANLDALTERRLIDTLQEIALGRSLLWITHRLVGLEAMDEILVLDGGMVVERGRHAALLESGGLYRRMWDLQNRALIGL